jgi:hypothetical protein
MSENKLGEIQNDAHTKRKRWGKPERRDINWGYLNDYNYNEIKSSFNELAKVHHPDYGGNPEVFKQLKLMRDSILAAYYNYD